MVDVHDLETRAHNMSRIPSKNTKPELTVRHTLHRWGYRYRLHAKCGSAKPDIVLKRYSAAIFVHGCFWHRHSGCKFATTPKTRQDFWEGKFVSNVVRDQNQLNNLMRAQWRVAVVWECGLRSGRAFSTLRALEQWLLSEDQFHESALHDRQVIDV